LPDIDGYEVCRQFADEHAHHHSRSFPDSEEMNAVTSCKGLELGADDYITKPFDIED